MLVAGELSRSVASDHGEPLVELTRMVVRDRESVLKSGGKGLKDEEGQVESGPGLVSWGFGNLVHLHQDLCDGGAVMDLQKILALYCVILSVVDED
jgi:hypothetical protein